MMAIPASRCGINAGKRQVSYLIEPP